VCFELKQASNAD
jgi:hypothetical protein